ncbi:hypothetical protein HYS95_02185 [Candidatus Daviesbacteria bacterium]|nr:hypothetical protein [Candidatus Daviesbacteria bacterium]
MLEYDKAFSIGNTVTFLAIPADAVPLSEMVEALTAEKNFVRSKIKVVEDRFKPEIIPLDEVPETEIEQVIARSSGSNYYYYLNRDPAEAVIGLSLREVVQDAVESLPFKQKRTLEVLFGLEDGRRRTVKEVGVMFRKTPATIRACKRAAFATLRENKTLKEFYGEDSSAYQKEAKV